MCAYVCVPQSKCGSQGTPVGVVSLLPLCGSQGLNLGHQAWWQAPLRAEHLTAPKMNFYPLELYFPKHYILCYFIFIMYL